MHGLGREQTGNFCGARILHLQHGEPGHRKSFGLQVLAARPLRIKRSAQVCVAGLGESVYHGGAQFGTHARMLRELAVSDIPLPRFSIRVDRR